MTKKKAAILTLPAWDSIPDAEKALVIRTCNAKRQGHGGFQWPESGMVECPDWSPKAECGNGLHGLLDGFGNWGLTSSDIDAIWMLVEVVRAEVVELDGKVKFPRANVIFCGSMADAMTRMGTHQIKLLIDAAKGAQTPDATDADFSRLAASGYASSLAASGYASRLAASGYASRLAASGYASSLAASGYASIVMGAGYRCTGSAGEGGCIALAYYEGSRCRVAVAYVGENGIKPNVAYRVDGSGNFVEA